MTAGPRAGNALNSESVPLLDTSILDGQQYNFESTALSTFVPVCKERGLTLLLPEPTEKEIERHIRQRSSDALAAVLRRIHAARSSA